MTGKNEEKDKNLAKETAGERQYTYGDYLSWVDDGRYELIEGKACMMYPAPSRRHQKIIIEFIRQLSQYLLEKDCEVYAAPFDVRLPEGDQDDENVQTVVQPDILLMCDEDKLDEKGVRGAPDLVMEVISPASGVRDRKVKRELYERHGVKEYWLVDYLEEVVEVYILNNDGEYGKSEVYQEEDVVPVSVLEDLKIDLNYVFEQ
ncbi:MAG: Uma2 family endonuclease [Halanaerobiales bacterium]